MSLKEKLREHLPTRKTPMTAEMIAERFGCARKTALAVMSQLIKEGVAKEVLVASKRRYVRAII
jgi:predicted ArsR family transcriptional regulator